MKRIALLVVLGLAGVLAVVSIEPSPRVVLPPPPSESCSGGAHCGCSAKLCGLPCVACCDPNTCSMTSDPARR
jgi:hypothetical protein